MASSSKPKRKYDVFLSFRGTGLRNSFLSHLYKALDQNGIYTFVDSEELRKGDQISPALMKAIEQSCIAVIVFSEDYASSQWCLEEVAKIMECQEEKDLTVLPVFYKVDPREVRGGRESYGRALGKHESKFGKDLEKVKRWKKALFNAGSLSGWHLNDEDESELIQRIVKKISTHLDRTPLHIAKHPVGIDSQVVKLKSMLNLESDHDVVMVGLWGQGGIGKTTLARALYNAIFREFEGSCLLENVREASKDPKGLVSLQEKLLYEILSLQHRLEVSSVNGGIKLIQHRFHHKKVLLVLDDVDDLHQLNALAGEGKWFGNGSRIIVTTRDKHLLTYHGIDQDYVYEVEALDDSEARELLSNHAFSTYQKLKIRTKLVDSVLNYARGLPLALEVLGSFLCGRREDEWESTLKKLSRIPDKTINDVLKISYDGLEENEREIFLHIACFFNGRHSEYVKKVLDGCNFEATIGLEILIERSLISIKHGMLQVHDLIQVMGMDIVYQECRDDPRRRSKLWQYDDVRNVLSSDMGDCAVKAIVLKPLEPKELSIHPNAFTKMRSLRLLILRNVHLSFQGPICLPNELRWIEWAGCDPWIPSSGQKKLVGLDMSNRGITVVPNQIKGFQKLKYLSLTNCNSLVNTPDLSFAPNLEELHISNCESLVEIHESIAYHDKLCVLKLRYCSELCVFPNILKSKNLRDLEIYFCPKFERFPDIPHKLEGLKNVLLGDTAIKEIPVSIENLVSLKKMDISDCLDLISVPSSIYKLQNMEFLRISTCINFIGLPKHEDSTDPHMKIGLPNLQALSLHGCNLLEVEFLENLSCFPLLRKLILSENNITSLPTTIKNRDHLSRLDIDSCHQLREIPELPPFLNILYAEDCTSLQTNGHLTSIDQWVRRGITRVGTASLAQDSFVYFDLPEGEMPDWVQPVEEDSISFMASKDLYDKFLGFVFYAINETKFTEPFSIVAHFNGEEQGYFGEPDIYAEFNHSSLRYCIPSDLWHVVDFGQIDSRYAKFSLTQLGKDVKKWGFRIICKQLEDDLKIEIQEKQLIDLAFLYEVDYESTDLETQSSPKDSSSETNLQEDLQDCERSTKDHIQIGSKRKHEFILPQGKRIKTILTSNSTDGDQNEMRLIDQLKNLHL